MSYNDKKQTSTNESEKRINLDEVVEDEFNLSKKKKVMNDSNDGDNTKPKGKINLNEDV